MKQPNSFKSYLITLLLLSPFIVQATPAIPHPTTPNPIVPNPTASKPITPITTHPATSLRSASPFLPHIPQIGPDGRLVIPTTPLLPRYPTHYQDFFKKHKAYEYGAGLSLQEIGRIAQSKGYTLYSNRAFNEIASVLSPAPLWPEWAEKIREVQKKDVGSIDTAGQLTTYYVQSKGDYLGYAYFGVIDKNNREGKQQTAFDAILPEINKRNFFADTIDKQNLTPEQRDKAWRAWDKQQEAAAPRKPTDEQRETWRKAVEYSQREAAIRANRSQYEQAKEDFWKHLGQTLDDTTDHAQRVYKAFEEGAPADYSYASKSVYYANAMWDATTVAAGALTQGTGIDNAVATGYDRIMFDAGKQYINEKVQQYQQWAAEHPEANEYVKFAAYSGSAYAGYKGTAAIDAAWAARKAAKENAKAVAREVAAQSRIAQNQAARKAANNAINERAAANASKPTSYKVPAAPSANAPKPAVPSANAPKPTPKPVVNNPSSPKPVMPAPMPYVPAVSNQLPVPAAAAVAARAAANEAKSAVAVNASAKTSGSVAARQVARRTENIEDARAGTGINSKTGQLTPNACGMACGQKLLTEQDIHVFQSNLTDGFYKGLTPEQLARNMNKFDNNWTGIMAYPNIYQLIDVHNKFGNFIARVGGNPAHFVIVENISTKSVKIWDPSGGVSKIIPTNEFMNSVTGLVYRKGVNP